MAERELKRMVYLRFGNVEGSGAPLRSYNKIASIMNKWPMTVHSALKRWEQNGRTAYDGRAKNGVHMKNKMRLQGPIKDFLLKKETLDEWSGHGLMNRCILLEKSKGVKVSWQVLRNFYVRNGVKYLFSNYAY